MERTIREQAGQNGATVKIETNNLCRAVRIAEDSAIVRLARRGLAEIGVEAKCVFITGFTDASIYNNNGIEMAVVGIGAQNEHTTRECIAVVDMERAVRALAAMLRFAAE